MAAEPFDEFHDRFEDQDTWLDDYDDRDDTFNVASEAAFLDDMGIDFSNLGNRKRLDFGPLVNGEDDEPEEDEDIAA